MENPRVATVVVNWNLRKDLIECLDSLLKTEYANHLIIVIDNGSEDDSVQWVKKQFPSIIVIELNENLGYAAALNIGIKYALDNLADYIFLLNNDTIVSEDVIYKLILRMEENPGFGIISPKILYYSNPEKIYSLGTRNYNFFPLPISFGNLWTDKPKYDAFVEYDYVTGCAMFTRASLYQDVGLFNTSYFMYYEDNDFCVRVKNYGLRIGCDGGCTILHKEAMSSKTKSNSIKINYLKARNKIWFYKKAKRGLGLYLAFFLIIIWAPVKLLSFISHGNIKMMGPYLKGLLVGFTSQPLVTTK